MTVHRGDQISLLPFGDSLVVLITGKPRSANECRQVIPVDFIIGDGTGGGPGEDIDQIGVRRETMQDLNAGGDAALEAGRIYERGERSGIG